MPVAAVLGWPLAHTLSPALHQAAYRAAGLDDWTYVARPTRPEDLAAALDKVRSGAVAGVNLTTPHKQAAAALVDLLERPADRLGAVNTVFVREAGWSAATPTSPGRCGPWQPARPARRPLVRRRPAVLLGTGGVALAVAFAWGRLAAARRDQGLPVAPCRWPAATPPGRPRRPAWPVPGRGRWAGPAPPSWSPPPTWSSRRPP